MLFFPRQPTVRLAFYKLSCDNLTDLFTKSIPYATFSKCVKCVGMYRLRYL
jgi:hypothetical protein